MATAPARMLRHVTPLVARVLDDVMPGWFRTERTAHRFIRGFVDGRQRRARCVVVALSHAFLRFRVSVWIVEVAS